MELYKFDAVNKTLVISAAFDRALSDTQSAEYRLYKQMLSDIPGLIVVRKTHKSPTSYKGDGKRTSYYPTKGLTIKKMEKFMNALPEGKKYLDEYNKLKAVAILCPSPYAAIRRWFEAQFPEYRRNPLFYVNNSVEVIDFAAILEAAKQSKEAV
ncbi:MAG: hypothetical protein J5965_01445 [Aeriscardovia sp.]|nr:hypothetical protein [Aeriscardovia sp.]